MPNIRGNIVFERYYEKLKELCFKGSNSVHGSNAQRVSNLKKIVVLEASPFGFVFYSQPHHHPLMNSMAFKSTVLVPIGSVSILLLTKIIDLGFTTI